MPWSPAATWSRWRRGWTSTCPRSPRGSRSGSRQACATEVAADRAIEVGTLPREEAFATHPDLIRTATDLLPPDLEVVRIVDIVGLDTQADGGTHVASTSQIGRIEVVKVENKGKGFRRLQGPPHRGLTA